MVSFSMDGIYFYNIDINYIKFLHDADSEVRYDPSYESSAKPYVGMLVSSENHQYFIPLTSAKPAHLGWHNVTDWNYVIWEEREATHVRPKWVYKEIPNTKFVKHYLSVLEINKMIPVKDGLFTLILFKNISDIPYKSLLEKEYRFIKPLRQEIEAKAQDIYNEQVNTGKIYKHYCNYRLLETACDSYNTQA